VELFSHLQTVWPYSTRSLRDDNPLYFKHLTAVNVGYSLDSFRAAMDLEPGAKWLMEPKNHWFSGLFRLRPSSIDGYLFFSLRLAGLRNSGTLRPSGLESEQESACSLPLPASALTPRRTGQS